MPAAEPISVRRQKGQIWRLLETAVETVRQGCLFTLVNDYGFTLEQIAAKRAAPPRGGKYDLG